MDGGCTVMGKGGCACQPNIGGQIDRTGVRLIGGQNKGNDKDKVTSESWAQSVEVNEVLR